MSRFLLVLDDDRNRLYGFEQIVRRLGEGWEIRTWRDAPSMIAELDRHLPDAGLISLDHDLYADSRSDPDPGTGRMVADALAQRRPVCPVLVHSTNTDAAWGMHNSLRRGGWTVALVHQLGQPEWIEALWLPAALRAVEAAGRPRSAAGSTLALAEYRALAGALPVPTRSQVRQFAEYVAGAHSWYKHLRLLPARAPVQVFLDPAAGMQRTQSADGSVSVAPRGKQGFHYSWLPTAEYRHRFGCLAFSKSSGTSVSLGTGDGQRLVPADDAPCVYDPAHGTWHALPEEALTAGRAYISGIVHASASWTGLWQDVIQRTERFDNVLEKGEGLEIAKRILDRCQQLKEDPARAEPAPAAEGEAKHQPGLSAFDLPLHRLVEAERQRQIEAIAAAAERLVRLVAPRPAG